jgi:NAD(P)-dependent dehydrogenase (short-subunit alcohol dehydrogenase family)
MHEKPPGPSANPTRTCLVTGAAKRLGRQIALAMAQSGWNVVVHFNQSADQAQGVVAEIQGLGRHAIAIGADLDAEDQVQQLFKAAQAELGPLTCIVNSASRFEFDEAASVSAQGLHAHLQSNLVAPLLLTRLLYAELKDQHRPGQDPLGVVIHLLDQKLFNPNPDFFSYTLSKAALNESVRLCAMAMAPVLRVVGVAPGLTLPSGDQTAAEFEQTHAMTPLGASSRAHEVADAVAWLATARAVTGTTLLVDGGQHLQALPRDVMMLIR